MSKQVLTIDYVGANVPGEVQRLEYIVVGEEGVATCVWVLPDSNGDPTIYATARVGAKPDASVTIHKAAANALLSAVAWVIAANAELQ